MVLMSETSDLVKSEAELFRTKFPSWTITPWRKKTPKKTHFTESKKSQLLAHRPVDVAGCSWFGRGGVFCVYLRLGETCHVWWSCRHGAVLSDFLMCSNVAHVKRLCMSLHKGRTFDEICGVFRSSLWIPCSAYRIMVQFTLYHLI